MTVYVVMGNDFPDGVFTTFEAAEEFCQLRREEDEAGGRRIFWRTYDFTLRDQAST